MRDTRNFIIWNGVSSLDMGMVMLSTAELPIPFRRGYADDTLEYLPGDYWTDYRSFDTITKEVSFRIGKIDSGKYYEIRGWLQGEGTLVFSEFPNVQYKARVSSAEVESSPNMKFIAVEFVIQPLGYLIPAEPVRSMDMDADELVLTMQNLGNVESYPVISVEGYGVCTINIKRGDEILQSLNIDYLSNEKIIMDSDPYVQESYSEDGAESMNNKMVGAFLRLPKGVFDIELVPRGEYDVFTEFTVEPRWRFV